jgi:hypothetical protein
MEQVEENSELKRFLEDFIGSLKLQTSDLSAYMPEQSEAHISQIHQASTMSGMN